MYRKLLITFVFIVGTNFIIKGHSQEKTLIILEKANVFRGENIDGITFNFLSGDVILIHDSTIFYCDSAVIDRNRNHFKAYGNIHAILNDSLDLYGNRLTYDGNSKITYIYDNVKLIDNKATLYTDFLIYSRLEKKGVFNRGGRIVDGENELTSQIGEYYSNLNEFHFRNEVNIKTPDYIITADTLNYNSETDIVKFNGYSTLTGTDDFMFAYDGWSDTKKNITILKNNAVVQHKQHIISGDSVYYDSENKYGYASNNAVLMDTEEDLIIEGQIVEYIEQKGYAYATDSAVAILIDKKDTLFLHSDTLKLLFDSLNKADLLQAFDKVKFYRKDLQGACNFLIYDLNDSIISMLKEPILWSDKYQLSSDSMKIFMTKQVLDSLVLYNSAKIISKDSTNTYNQIRGRDIIGYFNNNEIYLITVNGNSETIYYVRDEDNNKLIGINKAIASNMRITLEDKQIISILYIKDVSATLYPENELSNEDRIIKGFKWLDDDRPKSKKDIFRYP